MKRRIKEVTNLTIGPKVKALARKYCQDNEKSLSALVNDLLRNFLEKHEKAITYLQEAQRKDAQSTSKKISYIKSKKRR